MPMIMMKDLKVGQVAYVVDPEVTIEYLGAIIDTEENQFGINFQMVSHPDSWGSRCPLLVRVLEIRS